MEDLFLQGRTTDYSDGTSSIDTVDTVYPTPVDFKTYTVREGDSLDNISYLFYKDAKLWSKIAIANNIIDPFTLTTGSVLIIPNL
jgi:nucleoid-associated protein YgaU